MVMQLSHAYCIIYTIIMTTVSSGGVDHLKIYTGHYFSYDLTRGNFQHEDISNAKVLYSRNAGSYAWLKHSGKTLITGIPVRQDQLAVTVLLFCRFYMQNIKLCDTYIIRINVMRNPEYMLINFNTYSDNNNDKNFESCLDSSQMNIAIHSFITCLKNESKLFSKVKQLSSNYGYRLENVYVSNENDFTEAIKPLKYISISDIKQTDKCNERPFYVSFIIACHHSNHNRHRVRRDVIQDASDTSFVTNGVLSRQKRDQWKVFFGSISALVGTPIESTSTFTTTSKNFNILSSSVKPVSISQAKSLSKSHSMMTIALSASPHISTTKFQIVTSYASSEITIPTVTDESTTRISSVITIPTVTDESTTRISSVITIPTVTDEPSTRISSKVDTSTLMLTSNVRLSTQVQSKYSTATDLFSHITGVSSVHQLSSHASNNLSTDIQTFVSFSEKSYSSITSNKSNLMSSTNNLIYSISKSTANTLSSTVGLQTSVIDMHSSVLNTFALSTTNSKFVSQPSSSYVTLATFSKLSLSQNITQTMMSISSTSFSTSGKAKVSLETLFRQTSTLKTILVVSTSTYLSYISSSTERRTSSFTFFSRKVTNHSSLTRSYLPTTIGPSHTISINNRSTEFTATPLISARISTSHKSSMNTRSYTTNVQTTKSRSFETSFHASSLLSKSLVTDNLNKTSVRTKDSSFVSFTTPIFSGFTRSVPTMSSSSVNNNSSIRTLVTSSFPNVSNIKNQTRFVTVIMSSKEKSDSLVSTLSLQATFSRSMHTFSRSMHTLSVTDISTKNISSITSETYSTEKISSIFPVISTLQSSFNDVSSFIVTSQSHVPTTSYHSSSQKFSRMSFSSNMQASSKLSRFATRMDSSYTPSARVSQTFHPISSSTVNTFSITSANIGIETRSFSQLIRFSATTSFSHITPKRVNSSFLTSSKIEKSSLVKSLTSLSRSLSTNITLTSLQSTNNYSQSKHNSLLHRCSSYNQFTSRSSSGYFTSAKLNGTLYTTTTLPNRSRNINSSVTMPLTFKPTTQHVNKTSNMTPMLSFISSNATVFKTMTKSVFKTLTSSYLTFSSRQVSLLPSQPSRSLMTGRQSNISSTFVTKATERKTSFYKTKTVTETSKTSVTVSIQPTNKTSFGSLSSFVKSTKTLVTVSPKTMQQKSISTKTSVFFSTFQQISSSMESERTAFLSSMAYPSKLSTSNILSTTKLTSVTLLSKTHLSRSSLIITPITSSFMPSKVSASFSTFTKTRPNMTMFTKSTTFNSSSGNVKISTSQLRTTPAMHTTDASMSMRIRFSSLLYTDSSFVTKLSPSISERETMLLTYASANSLSSKVHESQSRSISFESRIIRQSISFESRQTSFSFESSISTYLPTVISFVSSYKTPVTTSLFSTSIKYSTNAFETSSIASFVPKTEQKEKTTFLVETSSSVSISSEQTHSSSVEFVPTTTTTTTAITTATLIPTTTTVITTTTLIPTTTTAITTTTLIPTTTTAITTTTLIPTTATAITTTTLIPNLRPVLISPIGHLFAHTGRLFTFTVNENTFQDIEDGGTRNLTLIATLFDGKDLKENNWLIFNTASQTFSGIPLEDDFKNSNPLSIILTAYDRYGSSVSDTFFIVISEPLKTLTFGITVTVAIDFNLFLRHKEYKELFLNKIKEYFSYPTINDLYITSIVNGSTKITWSETASGINTCNETSIIKTISMTQNPLTNTPNPDFARFMLPLFPVIGIESNFLGACLINYTTTPMTTTSVGVAIETVSDNDYIYYTIPIVILAIIMIIILLILAYFWRYRKQSNRTYKNPFYIPNKPVLFPDEIELRQISNTAQPVDKFTNNAFEEDVLDGGSVVTSSNSDYSNYSDSFSDAKEPPPYLFPPAYMRRFFPTESDV